jgi:hypothetical protein
MYGGLYAHSIVTLLPLAAPAICSAEIYKVDEKGQVGLPRPGKGAEKYRDDAAITENRTGCRDR